MRLFGWFRRKKNVVVDATDPVFGFVAGRVPLQNIHPSTACAGRNCVIHNPSNHKMRHLPMLYRSDKRLMERVCSHGIGHPDPDDLNYHISQGRFSIGVHGCDGCCR